MAYDINLEKISLGTFEQFLMESHLVPSRMILKEYAAAYFQRLKSFDFSNVQQLIKAFKSKSSINSWAEKTGIPAEYLSILVREIKGYKRGPIKLEKFPGVKAETIQSLADAGIVNTIQLFDKTIDVKSRELLCSAKGIDHEELLLLTRMVDLSRIRWVNQTFAYVLHEVGYDSAEKVALADPTEMYEKVRALNEERKLFPAHIGQKDMARCVEAAQLVQFEVEY